MKNQNKPETTLVKRVGKSSGYKSNILWMRREKRQQEAEQRQAIHDDLTTAQKIAKAKKRPGESKRELARLNKPAKKS
jgi:hypothetical protein